MSLRLQHVTFDVFDAERVATFWAAALGLDVLGEPSPDFAVVGGEGLLAGHPKFMFAKVPEGKEGKNRVHLDIAASDSVADEIVRLERLGATQMEEKTLGNFSWTIMADPEGNEFCVSVDH